eukprot:scaffold1954_cov268-Pinguiococcus_pyrenoidosus.AAC.230
MASRVAPFFRASGWKSPGLRVTSFLLVTQPALPFSAVHFRTLCRTQVARSLDVMPAGATKPSRGVLSLDPAPWSPEAFRRLEALLEEPVDERPGFRPVAAFDADGTLWGGDAFDAFTQVLVREGKLGADATAQAGQSYADSKGDARRAALAGCTKLLEGLTLEEIQDAAYKAWGTYEERGLKDTVFWGMADLIAALQSRGWRTVLVTASPAASVIAGAEAMGISEGDIFGIRLAVDDRGRTTGEMHPSMPVSWNEGKPEALRAAGLGGRVMFAAGNSIDDVPMLLMAKQERLMITSAAADGALVGESESTALLRKVGRL